MNPMIQLKSTILRYLGAAGLSLTFSLTARAQVDGDLGNGNTAEGDLALAHLTTVLTALNNTAIGVQALNQNSTGGYNTATGSFALQNNNGDENTATGSLALEENTTGSSNTATGVTHSLPTERATTTQPPALVRS